MAANLTCPFCGGPADGYDADHVAKALFAEASDQLDKMVETWQIFEDFISTNFDDVSEETKAELMDQSVSMANSLESVFYDTQ